MQNWGFMGKGRKATPNALKELRGTDQPVRMRDEINTVPITDPIVSIPRGSQLQTKRARDIFKRKANQLIALRVLTDMDLELLGVYASSLDMFYTCVEKIGSEDLVVEVTGKNGTTLVKNPYLSIMSDMVDTINRIGGEFGFSPVSRQKLKAEVKEEDNPFKELIQNV